MKYRGGLIHINEKFFHLVRYVESCFAKRASNFYVFDLTFEDVLATYNLSFPCEEYGSHILSYAIVYSIVLRMKQNALQENLETMII